MLKILAVILTAVIVAGCTQPSQTKPNQIQSSQTKSIPNLTNQSSSVTVCNPPQIRFGTGCCLDSNSNGICDTGEDKTCWDVVCNNYCSGNTIYYKGRCASGACQYSSMTCPDACMNGTCISFNPMYQNKSFGIDANWTVGSKTVFVEFTNIGISSIDMMQVAVYLDGKYANITSGNTGILASRNSKILNITLKTPACANMILVTLPSGQSQSGTVRCLGKGFGQIQVMSPWSITASNGAMRLNVLNMVGGEITVTGAKVGTYTYNASQSLASGESAIIPFVTNKWPSNIKPGSSYTVTVTVSYNYNGSAFSSTGTLSGTYF